jgi:hypothetical protein
VSKAGVCCSRVLVLNRTEACGACVAAGFAADVCSKEFQPIVNLTLCVHYMCVIGVSALALLCQNTAGLCYMTMIRS